MNIMLPIVLSIGVTVLADLTSKGTVRLSVLLGGFLYGLISFGVSEINAELGIALAWVVAFTALLTSGEIVFNALSKGMK